jgi:hypothetical protein
LNSTSTAANVLVANNIISDIAGVGFNGFNQSDNGYGIMVNSGGGYRLYFNTVVMNANQTASGGHSSALNVESGVTAAGLDIRNNNFVSTQTIGNRYAVIDQGTTSAAYSNIEFNNYFSAEAGFNIGRLNSVNQTTLAGWQGATGQDIDSVSVAPSFVSATNFHLQSTSLLINAGGATTTMLAEVPDDFDGQSRPNMSRPARDSVLGITEVDIGGDEFYAPTAAGSTVSGRLVTPSGRGLSNAQVVLTNTRTGEVRVVRSSSFGRFNFEELSTGDFYILEVPSKRYRFNPLSFTLNEDLTDLVLTANP